MFGIGWIRECLYTGDALLRLAAARPRDEAEWEAVGDRAALQYALADRLIGVLDDNRRAGFGLAELLLAARMKTEVEKEREAGRAAARGAVK